jgi:hypothetical protein
MPLFLKFIYFLHSFIQYNSPRPVFLNPHRVFAQQGEPPWDAEPRFELGPALQQADALPTELRRILTLFLSLNFWDSAQLKWLLVFVLYVYVIQYFILILRHGPDIYLECEERLTWWW